MLTGQNGILNRAQEAKEKTEQGQKEEQSALSTYEDYINEYETGIKVEQVTDTKPGELEIDETEENSYIINSIEDLVFFAYDVTNGNTYEGKTVKLGLSLDFNSTKSYVDPFRTDYGEYGYNGELKTLLTAENGFKPIGTTFDEEVSTNYFCGTFNGNYNYIYNLYQNYEDSNNTSIIGLFSTNAGTISNVIISANTNSTTNNMHIVSGILVGRNNGTIINCGVNGNLKVIENGIKASYCGGITGQNIGIVEQCFSKANINVVSNNTSNQNVGGIVGENIGEYIKSCYNMGNIEFEINTDSIKHIGGIAGRNRKKIENSYNNGKLNIYFNCESTKDITLGNIVGVNNGENTIINNCFNIGDINADVVNENDKICISNIIGMTNYGNINNCYNIGKLDIKNKTLQNVGQIVGISYMAVLNNCFGSIEENINEIGTQSSTTTNNIKLVSKDEIPAILQIIGENFKNDSENINNGFPVLNWQ